MAKKKIWMIGDEIYRSEKGFLEAVKKCGDISYQVFTVSKSGKTSTLREKLAEEEAVKKRDMKVRSVLNELTPTEEKELSFESDVKELLRITREIHEKSINNYSHYNSVYSSLCEHKDNRQKLISYLKQNKKEVLDYSTDVEYFKALLKIHPFKSPTTMKWSYGEHGRGQGYVDVLNLHEDCVEAFYKAKEELKKQK